MANETYAKKNNKSQSQCYFIQSVRLGVSRTIKPVVVDPTELIILWGSGMDWPTTFRDGMMLPLFERTHHDFEGDCSFM